MIQNEHIEEFLRQAHRVGDAGLTVCSSGNLSWRVGDEVLVFRYRFMGAFFDKR